jgi:glutamate---cysteine ligase / carboxylate-amine ligase
MMPNEPKFTIGVEEEYLLADLDTRDLVADPPSDFWSECEAALVGAGSQVTAEFMRSQVEIGTRVCSTMQEVRNELAALRGAVDGVARPRGFALLAASTHPFADWQGQCHTNKERYNILAQDLQVVARRMLICGMHVHVGVEDDETRIDLMNQASYFLPHLLALSTSSPFWQGVETGLKSYRLSVFDEMPRTGLPEQFSSFGEYSRTVGSLIKTGVIEDGTKIWWDLRPSARFPTLEMRITDVCTLIDDAVCVAALFRCILRMLYRLRRNNQRWRSYPNFLLSENRWRAQRYGVEGSLVDFGRGELIPLPTLIEELLSLIHEDAEFFGCVSEVMRARTILSAGTSADRQAAVFHHAIRQGASTEEAQKAVVDALIAESLHGVDVAPAKLNH